jgi:flagellar motor protein MotB
VLSAAGCADKEKKQIQALYAEKQDLLNQNTQLRDQLSQLSDQDAKNQAALSDKDSQIAAQEAKIKELSAHPGSGAAGAAGPAAAQGWEHGLTADRVTVGSDVLFSPGKATLTSAGEQALAKIAADIHREYQGLPVRVYGYTDSDPIAKSHKLWSDNLDLSANRAMAVTRYLIGKGIPAEHIETIAMGATNAAAPNSSAAGKTRNRRVEIFVIKTSSR